LLLVRQMCAMHMLLLRLRGVEQEAHTHLQVRRRRAAEACLGVRDGMICTC
jgi:hypothetical protein